MNHICTNGHDLCSTSYPSENCPYCEAQETGPKDAVLEYWKNGTIKVFANGRQQELPIKSFSYIIKRINKELDGED